MTGLGTRSVQNPAPPLSTKDSYGGLNDDASLVASAHLTPDGSVEDL
jgi:hypothetical protein